MFNIMIIIYFSISGMLHFLLQLFRSPLSMFVLTVTLSGVIGLRYPLEIQGFSPVFQYICSFQFVRQLACFKVALITATNIANDFTCRTKIFLLSAGK